MSNPKHILIVGNRGVGKSTLISRLLPHSSRPICGFITKSLPPDETGFHPIYIHPASAPVESRVFTEENLIGTCDTKIHNVNLNVFDTLGVTYLSDLPKDGLIVMDELGFMEAGSEIFTRKVTEALDGDTPVIAAVKSRKDIPFLTKVRSHPKAAVYEITPENRDELYETLLPLIEEKA